MNDLNILDAMKERLKSVVPPVGYALRNVYATPPEALPVVPSIVFFPGDDTVSIGSGNRTVTLTVNAVLYLTPIPRMDQKYRDLFTWRSWIRTSYNTRGGVHRNGGTPYRKNYAGIGSTYDPVADAFYSPKPDENSILNPETYLWEPDPSITQNTEE